jgi:DNA-binding transcriptional LysR family regulator
MARKSWHSLSEYQALRAMMEGNTTASAARRLGISQSAISRALSNLESRVGITLFEREAGRLNPTGAAVRLNARLDALFEALDSIDGPADTAREQLRLIAPPSFAHQFITGHIAGFLKSRPESFLTLEIGTSQDVVNGVQEGRFDLGVIGVEPTRAGAKMIPFRRSLAACIMPAGHPLAAHETVKPADIHRENLIGFSYRHARRSQLDKILHEANSVPTVVCEVSSSTAAVDLVVAGAGIVVGNPFPLIQYAGDNLVFRPFSSAITYQTYFVAPDHRPLSRVARHFIRHVRLHTPRDSFSEAV